MSAFRLPKFVVRAFSNAWSAPIILAIAALSGSACAGATAVRAKVTVPAAMPLHTFPTVWVASGHEQSEMSLAQAIVRSLSQGGRSRVTHIIWDRLEPLRRGGQIPEGSAVLWLELSVDEGSRAEWRRRPATVCGPGGCSTVSQTEVYDVPTLSARLHMTVYDGPSARVLQKLTIRAAERGRSYPSMRRQAVQELAKKVRQLVRRRQREIEVELLDVDLPETRAATTLIEQGQWTKGRALLEQASQNETSLAALPVKKRARFYYNLSLARRFDPQSLRKNPEEHFRAAEKPLRTALELDPDERRYQVGLKALRAHYDQARLVREQKRVASENFKRERARKESPEQEIPPPPPSYNR